MAETKKEVQTKIELAKAQQDISFNPKYPSKIKSNSFSNGVVRLDLEMNLEKVGSEALTYFFNRIKTIKKKEKELNTWIQGRGDFIEGEGVED